MSHARWGGHRSYFSSSQVGRKRNTERKDGDVRSIVPSRLTRPRISDATCQVIRRSSFELGLRTPHRPDTTGGPCERCPLVLSLQTRSPRIEVRRTVAVPFVPQKSLPCSAFSLS